MYVTIQPHSLVVKQAEEVKWGEVRCQEGSKEVQKKEKQRHKDLKASPCGGGEGEERVSLRMDEKEDRRRNSEVTGKRNWKNSKGRGDF